MERWSIFLITVSILAGCSETPDSEYESFNESIDSGAVERGWIPSWTPKSAKNIYEVHNLDTNNSMLAAQYEKSEEITLPKVCKQIGSFDAPAPPFKRRWWPSDVPAGAFSTYRHTFFTCGTGEYAAWGQGEFYYWRVNGA